MTIFSPEVSSSITDINIIKLQIGQLKAKYDSGIIGIGDAYFYTTPPEEVTIRSQANYLLNMKDMLNQDKVYIESLSSDPFIQGKVTGWYKHSPGKDFLINDIGLTLSYEGLGIYYNAIGFYPSNKASK